jgi:hypothetical protein
MAIETGAAFVLAYVLVSVGVIITFGAVMFMIGWSVGRLRERRRGRPESEHRP